MQRNKNIKEFQLVHGIRSPTTSFFTGGLVFTRQTNLFSAIAKKSILFFFHLRLSVATLNSLVCTVQVGTQVPGTRYVRYDGKW